MGRPKKSAPKHIDAEFESQEIPEEELEAEEEADEPTTSGTMSKADACRAALADGITETEDAVRFCKSQFGVDIKPTDFTLYKSKAKKSGAEGSKKTEPAKRGRKPNVAPPSTAASATSTAPKAPATGRQPDLMTALEGVKELVGQFGADQVKRMVDLLG